MKCRTKMKVAHLYIERSSRQGTDLIIMDTQWIWVSVRKKNSFYSLQHCCHLPEVFTDTIFFKLFELCKLFSSSSFFFTFFFWGGGGWLFFVLLLLYLWQLWTVTGPPCAVEEDNGPGRAHCPSTGRSCEAVAVAALPEAVDACMSRSEELIGSFFPRASKSSCGHSQLRQWHCTKVCGLLARSGCVLGLRSSSFTDRCAQRWKFRTILDCRFRFPPIALASVGVGVTGLHSCLLEYSTGVVVCVLAWKRRRWRVKRRNSKVSRSPLIMTSTVRASLLGQKIHPCFAVVDVAWPTNRLLSRLHQGTSLPSIGRRLTSSRSTAVCRATSVFRCSKF